MSWKRRLSRPARMTPSHPDAADSQLRSSLSTPREGLKSRCSPRVHPVMCSEGPGAWCRESLAMLTIGSVAAVSFIVAPVGPVARGRRRVG